MSSKPPRHYLNIRERHPEFIEAVESLGLVLRQQGPLDDISGQLVHLASAVAIRSEGAVHSHVKRALQYGASTEEIRHTIILLTSTVGFPTAMAALSWADDVIDEYADDDSV